VTSRPPPAIHTSGKRKTAVARATLSKGSGRVWINDRPLELLEPEAVRWKIQEPLVIVGDRAQVLDVQVSVRGGGLMGQASAARTAIARGLVRFLEDPALEDLFKRYDRSLLVNDPRRKLPKRPQGRGARKRRQKSYR
jgi:small subunit ribosomal protein S9